MVPCWPAAGVPLNHAPSTKAVHNYHSMRLLLSPSTPHPGLHGLPQPISSNSTQLPSMLPVLSQHCVRTPPTQQPLLPNTPYTHPQAQQQRPAVALPLPCCKQAREQLALACSALSQLRHPPEGPSRALAGSRRLPPPPHVQLQRVVTARPLPYSHLEVNLVTPSLVRVSTCSTRLKAGDMQGEKPVPLL